MWTACRYRLDDVLSGSPLTAATLSDVSLRLSPENLLALLLFLGRHAGAQARAQLCLQVEVPSRQPGLTTSRHNEPHE